MEIYGSPKKYFKRWMSVAFASAVAIFFAPVPAFFATPSSAIPNEMVNSIIWGVGMSFMSTVLIWWVFSLCVFTGVEMRPGWVVVKNLFASVSMPAGSVAGVTWRGGLRVHTDVGKAYRCTAFPDSLYSLVIGYRNFRVVARRIERALAEQPQPAPTGPAVERTELRGWLFWWLLGGLFSGYLIVFVLSRFVF